MTGFQPLEYLQVLQSDFEIFILISHEVQGLHYPKSLHTSVTFQEATAPVKLPTYHSVRNYFFLEQPFNKGSQSSFPLANISYIARSTCHHQRNRLQQRCIGSFRLAVLSRIFTTISISQRQYWRQRGSRYTICAGRNLPVKGFCYLRTVRVTAAVYWDLQQKRKPLSFILQHWAGVRFYTSLIIWQNLMFLRNSRYPLFKVTLQSSLSRSYRVNLPSSFNIIHSFAFIYQTSLLVLELVRCITQSLSRP
eukprot:TRINITY_DN435_c0_g1_i8.p1 TRINITY_DN435_c0_g1~~TRINITY_DN435_c0_g1_i8.p1  ORF type:complete len:250 (+),score=-67.41 TRINITY_DN435_c0_g1_i8:1069-1818(+)